MNRPAALAALVSEAFEGLVRARRMTGLSVALIAISIGLVGSFFLVAENLESVVETVRDESAVTVFLKSSATEADRADLERLAAETRLVVRMRRVSPEEARARFSKWWKSLGPAARSLPGNPFPASLEMELDPAAVASEALPPFLKLLASHRAAEEVQFDVEWIHRLRGAVSLARLSGAVLAVLLTLGAAFTIANVVSGIVLTSYREIGVMKAVGFTPGQVTTILVAQIMAPVVVGTAAGVVPGAFWAFGKWPACVAFIVGDGLLVQPCS